MNASPLGRYSEVSAFLAAIAVIVAWLAVHTGLLSTAGDTAAIDTAFALVIGVLLGQRQSTNGAGKIAASAHSRLDVLETKLGVVTHPPVGP